MVCHPHSFTFPTDFVQVPATSNSPLSVLVEPEFCPAVLGFRSVLELTQSVLHVGREGFEPPMCLCHWFTASLLRRLHTDHCTRLQDVTACSPTAFLEGYGFPPLTVRERAHSNSSHRDG